MESFYIFYSTANCWTVSRPTVACCLIHVNRKGGQDMFVYILKLTKRKKKIFFSITMKIYEVDDLHNLIVLVLEVHLFCMKLSGYWIILWAILYVITASSIIRQSILIMLSLEFVCFTAFDLIPMKKINQKINMSW